MEVGTLAEEYALVDDKLKCLHVNFNIVKACCPSFGLIECSCQGYDEIVCPNPKCDGVTQEDVERILYGDIYDVSCSV